MAAPRFPVEAGHVLMFSRALGAADPPGGALPAVGDPAPPTFAIAAAQFDPGYPLRPKPGHPWHGSGGDAGVIRDGAGGLHAEQHFTYHRPIRVGDVLIPATRPGEAWEKLGRSGRLRFREQITEFRDESGELVVTARSVSVQWETSAGEGERGGGVSPPSQRSQGPGVQGAVPRGSRAGGHSPGSVLRAGDLTAGQTFEMTVVADLKRTQIVQYAGASGDFNPLHTDEIYATKTGGYPSVFAHGMLTMGLTGQAIAALAGPDQLLQFGVRFTDQVWPGDTLTVRASAGLVDDRGDEPAAQFEVSTVAASMADGDGREVVSGYFRARVAR
jgi:acyl dehydratase